MPRLRKEQKKLIADTKKLLKHKPRTGVELMLQSLMRLCIRKIEEKK